MSDAIGMPPLSRIASIRVTHSISHLVLLELMVLASQEHPEEDAHQTVAVRFAVPLERAALADLLALRIAINIRIALSTGREQQSLMPWSLMLTCCSASLEGRHLPEKLRQIVGAQISDRRSLQMTAAT